jgi:hypothetical protein
VNVIGGTYMRCLPLIKIKHVGEHITSFVVLSAKGLPSKKFPGGESWKSSTAQEPMGIVCRSF